MTTSRLMNADANDSQNSEEASPPLLSLPDEVRQTELYTRSPLGLLGMFAQTSHQDETETAFLRLLPSAVNAEPMSYKRESYQWADKTSLAAIAILKRHPGLLFKTGQVKDHFDREFEASAYRLFLGAGDIWALNQVHEEIIAKIKDQKARAQAEAQTQVEFQTQFPDYTGPWPLDPNMPEEALYDERNKTQIKQVIDQLKIIVEKIAADPCTDSQATKKETAEAVADLCQIFASKEGEIIKTGLHFPVGIMKEIAKVYDAQFGLWSEARLAFFSRAVIGGAEASLSAVDGQCVKNGLVFLNMEEKGPDRQDGLFCRRPKGVPGDLIPLVDKLGHRMFIDAYDGNACFLSAKAGHFDWYNKNHGAVEGGPRGGWGWGDSYGSQRSLENLWNAKVAAYGSYYSAVQREVNTSIRRP